MPRGAHRIDANRHFFGLWKITPKMRAFPQVQDKGWDAMKEYWSHPTADYRERIGHRNVKFKAALEILALVVGLGTLA